MRLAEPVRDTINDRLQGYDIPRSSGSSRSPKFRHSANEHCWEDSTGVCVLEKWNKTQVGMRTLITEHVHRRHAFVLSVYLPPW